VIVAPEPFRIESRDGSYPVHFLERITDGENELGAGAERFFLIDGRVAQLHAALLDPIIATHREPPFLPTNMLRRSRASRGWRKRCRMLAFHAPGRSS